MIVLSFIADYTGGKRNSPVLNLSDKCDDVENCEQVAQDIKYCQQRGIKMLLSMGGAAGPYHTQSWDPDLLAWWVWNKFLAGEDRTLSRPFGDVILDGIDFDPECKYLISKALQHGLTYVCAVTDGRGYDKHIDTLRHLFKTVYPPRQFYITAAPQCPDLDAYDGNAVYNILHPSSPKYDSYPDMVFVQFYNNYCSAASFSPSSKNQQRFNFDEWDKWAAQETKGKAKVLLGVMGKENHMDTGYVDYEKMTLILDNIKEKSSFGGVMMWDARYAYDNPVPALSGIQYGEAVGRYLSEPGTAKVQQQTMALFRETNSGQAQDFGSTPVLPVLLAPVPHTSSRLPCAGQNFVLLRPSSCSELVRSFGADSNLINNHLSRLGIDPEASLVPGSTVCVAAGKPEASSLAIQYVHNGTLSQSLVL